jgi:hypothetical protein
MKDWKVPSCHISQILAFGVYDYGMRVTGVVPTGNQYESRSSLVQITEYIDCVLFHFGHIAHFAAVGWIDGVM